MNSPMAMITKGIVNTALIQKRRVMSLSSGFSSSSRVTVRGSKAMPHLGQLPGSSRTISGCMGQVYSVLVADAGIPSGSRAMPHFGQLPGPSRRISGCIGQVWIVPAERAWPVLPDTAKRDRGVRGDARDCRNVRDYSSGILLVNEGLRTYVYVRT